MEVVSISPASSFAQPCLPHNHLSSFGHYPLLLTTNQPRNRISVVIVAELTRRQISWIHYYGRLAAKQGWRFDSSYNHKDSFGESIPFVFEIGSDKVIAAIQSAVRSMKPGGIRRLVIQASQWYQTTPQEPIPSNFFDRQRLFTTIFKSTRLANGEGSILGTLIFYIDFISLRRQ